MATTLIRGKYVICKVNSRTEATVIEPNAARSTATRATSAPMIVPATTDIA